MGKAADDMDDDRHDRSAPVTQADSDSDSNLEFSSRHLTPVPSSPSQVRCNGLHDAITDLTSEPTPASSPSHGRGNELYDAITDLPTEPTSNRTSSNVDIVKAIRLNQSEQPGAIRVYPGGYNSALDYDETMVDRGLYCAGSVHLGREVEVQDLQVFEGVVSSDNDCSELPVVPAQVRADFHITRRRLALVIAGLVLAICSAVVIALTTTPSGGSQEETNTTFDALPTMVEKLALSLPSYTVKLLRNELPVTTQSSNWFNNRLWRNNTSDFQPVSPQGKAWKWLMSHPKLDSQPFLTERFALASLYFATNGTNWKNNDNWLNVTEHICNWWADDLDYPSQKYFDYCQGPDRFRYLRLSANGLDGPLPPELGLLTDLIVVELDENALRGSIHEGIWKGWIKIDQLGLNDNALTGSLPSTIGLLSNMRGLFLNNNQFTGTLPSALGQMSTIQYLHLSSNRLSGIISPDIGNLKLLGLHLSENRFSGPIPSSFGNLKLSEAIMLGANNLSGSIPTEIGLCRSLQTVDLSRNPMLSGTIPSEFGRLRDVWIMFMNGCNITGTLPQQLFRLDRLVTLDVSDTRLSGTVPEQYGQLSRLSNLHIYGTDMSGSIPSSVCQTFVDKRVSEGLIVDCDQVVCDCNCTCEADDEGSRR